MRHNSNKKPIFAVRERSSGKSTSYMGRREILGISILAVFSITGFCMASVLGNREPAGGRESLSDPIESHVSCGSPESERTEFSTAGSGSGAEDVFPSPVGSDDDPLSKGSETTGVSDIYLPLRVEEEKTPVVIASTLDFFKGRIPSLCQMLQNSGFFFYENKLDPVAGTTAYIIAKNQNYAQNLNGYFYYLFDEKGASTALSPFVLNISTLFEEENRNKVTESGAFAEPEHAQALRQSLAAALGVHYSDEVYDFIMEEYVRTFRERMNGEALQTPAYKLRLPGLEAVFHNSFLTYVEFYIDP